MYNNTLLLHGGYRTFFPYPHTNARGAGPGTATIGSDGFTPYPTYPFYLDDLWEYSFGACDSGVLAVLVVGVGVPQRSGPHGAALDVSCVRRQSRASGRSVW